MSGAMVEVEELRKEFPRRGKSRQDPPIVAVAGVSFEIPQGEIFGLLGPNKSQKTRFRYIATASRRRNHAGLNANSIARMPRTSHSGTLAALAAGITYLETQGSELNLYITVLSSLAEISLHRI